MSVSVGLPMQDYMKMRGFSNSVAWRVITQSPFHARYSQTAPREEAGVADIGTIAHKILLEGSEEGIALIDADDWRTKAAKELRDAAYAEGKTPLLERKMEPIRDMVAAARKFVAQSEIAGVFDTGNAEVTIDWNDDGLPCKIRPDYLTDQWHISLKTTPGSANPASWIRRQLTPMGYDFGLMFYERGLLANNIDVDHRLLVIEQEPPYGCCVVALAPSKREIAGNMVHRAIQIWKNCKATGVYPCYSTETHFAEAAAWEHTEALERENDDGAFFSDAETEGGIPH